MGYKSSDKILRKMNLQAKELECLYVFGRVVWREREKERQRGQGRETDTF